jgi:hypothetical protein
MTTCAISSDDDWAGLGVVATSAAGATKKAYFEKVIFVSLDARQ